MMLHSVTQIEYKQTMGLQSATQYEFDSSSTRVGAVRAEAPMALTENDKKKL